MNAQLIKEAIDIEDRLYRQKFDAALSERLSQIWQELKQPYAHLFTGQNIGEEVGAGWWEELLTTFEKISETMKSAPEHRFVVRQIKEKFGGIRFYFAIEKIGEEEEDLDDDAPAVEDPVKQELWGQLRDVIEALEERTSTRCEICGEPGELRSGGWLKTLCADHAKRRGEWEL